MSRRIRELDDTEISKKDDKAIDEAEYMLRQLALAGKLREHTGTLRQRYATWLSCFDIVMVPREDGIPNDHCALVFDRAALDGLSPERDIRPGDSDAVLSYVLMLLLRINSLILLPKAEAQRMRKNDLIGFYRLSDEKASQVLNKARAGDPIAYEILRDLVRQHQNREGGEGEMPLALRKFRDLQLDNKIAYRPPVGMTQSQTQRDSELVKLVHHFTGKDYSPTRSQKRPTKTPSATFIVQQAAKRLDINIRAPRKIGPGVRLATRIR